MKKLTIDTFIARAREKHGDKYTYENVEYVNNRTKVSITCKKHGPFDQTPDSHLTGKGCSDCGGSTRMNTDVFIAKSKEIHGDTYTYENVEYVNARTKVSITCKMHGPFDQLPSHHLRGNGCPDCGGRTRMNIDKFIARASETHGDKYTYENVEYVNNITKVSIICKKHGPFDQTPKNHLTGRGCPVCGNGWTKKVILDRLINDPEEALKNVPKDRMKYFVENGGIEMFNEFKDKMENEEINHR